MANAITKVALRHGCNFVNKIFCESTGGKLKIRHVYSIISFSNNTKEDVFSARKLSVGAVKEGSAARAETTSTTQGLSKLQAQELVLRLTDEERAVLISALQEYHSKIIKDEYEGQTQLS